MDVGLGVGRGGGWAGGGGANEALVGCIVRPTNPMTRDPAFVLALLRGEGVERWGWSVWGVTGEGSCIIRIGQDCGGGEV